MRPVFSKPLLLVESPSGPPIPAGASASVLGPFISYSVRLKLAEGSGTNYPDRQWLWGRLSVGSDGYHAAGTCLIATVTQLGQRPRSVFVLASGAVGCCLDDRPAPFATSSRWLEEASAWIANQSLKLE
jgi:hypothetical protein